MTYTRRQRRDIRRLYKLSQRRDWCEHYSCCGHFECSDAFWRSQNQRLLLLGIAKPEGLGLRAYYKEEGERLKVKAWFLRQEAKK